MGLRERKKAATRAALSWAAIRLTVERGFDNVKVEDIAAAAGVSPRTFNNYFAGKGEAIVSRHLDRLRRVADELHARPADEPLWTAITEAVLAQLEPGPELVAHPVPDRDAWIPGVRAMLAEPALQGDMLRAAATAEAEFAVAVAERTGTDPDDLYPHLVAAVVMAAANVAQSHHLRAGPPVSMRHLLTETLALVAAGLPPPATDDRPSTTPPPA
ncbi:TetR family transcriptional regulator [Amorphoplanes nipponensis]|uniref:TetR family transcriptional regulator n=1 Tax=Actinoplanes nipponensis TaxID=135950 RepID=A0A919MML1_9ACTN|nr:TetR family transcriptional regulator [Actinoplanes nipponensis]GIE50661.1 TetR family transcriptional regulator [Actinoplanes nipponensis]